MKYIHFFTIGIMLTATVISCKSKTPQEKIPEEIIPVKIIPLQEQNIQQTIHASGLFTTDDETNLSFKTGGIINRIFVKEGDAVKQGQLLATLNLTEINAATEQAALAYQKAERDYQRAYNLYRDSVATLEQMQNAKTALDLARQQYNAADFNKSYSEIRAVKNGYVLRKYLNEGQIVNAGMPVLQINGAGRQANWQLKAGVSDYQWTAIHKGDKATIVTDAAPGKQLKAVVSGKSEGIDPLSGTFIIYLKLTDAQQVPLAAGLFGKAIIIPSSTTSAWAIPYDALLDGDTDNGYVFITNDNKTAKKVKVQISKLENEKVIISNGLQNAKALIVSGNAYLNEGSKIKITNPSTVN